MKECGTPNVPSFYALRKLQKKLTQDVGLRPRHHTSALDNQFYMNHPNDLLRLDFSNPLVREYLHFYPEITTTISESWQAEKYVKEIEEDDLSPMWANWDGASHRHFYIKELSQCKDGKYFVPLKWIVYRKQVHCDAYLVTKEMVCHIHLRLSQELNFAFSLGFSQLRNMNVMVRVLATDLCYNFLDLQAQGEVRFSGIQNAFTPHMPHPVREIAQGRPVFVLRIMPWADDVSGNRSKQYNAHMNMYIANINLPHKLLAQEYFVRFCATSQYASSLEQFDALAEDCMQKDWTSTYDCKLQQEILFRIGIHLLPADNPQQAETTSTAGSSANLWCREDEVGGSATHRETDKGYHALFAPGKPRTPEDTIAKIKKQIRAACLGVATAVENLQTETGVKDKIATHWIELLLEEAQKIQQERVYNRETRDPRLNDVKIKNEARQLVKQSIINEIQEQLFAWVIMQPPERYEKLDEQTRTNPELRPGDHYNVLLRLRGLDPHRDSPCEILHTVLLGEDKYVWYETTKVWNDQQGALFAARLQSASIDGLNLPPLRAQYMVQYKKSLIGKHYKALQQVGIFQLDSQLCSSALFDLWKANGVLGALIWFPVIKDMEQYLADLTVAIDNVLDRWAIVDPTKITQKYKLHVLPHIPSAVRRFGPSILFATEIFECWNSVFRLCSVLSNHQAPSLDIATTLADMERFKHQVSGGWWKPSDGDWTQAGYKIQTFLTGNRQLQRRLGWTPVDAYKAGSVVLVSKTKQQPDTWRNILGSSWNNTVAEPAIHSNKNWIACKYAVSRSQEPCFPGSWVFVLNGVEVSAARIIKILSPEHSLTETEAVVVLQKFTISDTVDAHYEMPLLMKTENIVVSKPEHLVFKFNAQHDCHHFSCSLADAPGQQQERSESKLTWKIRAHKEDSRFLVNTHATHNAHLVRETLPHSLTAPKPCFVDRLAKHSEFASALREVGPEKRAQASARGQATKARNKQEKADKAAGVMVRGGDVATNIE
ncbi:hypothetical protein DFH08DRAFT_718875 [Mycena albidolilacea]|uniref:Uncharacterized protein n=1 Tax=Mycena albidolilacea TaxID=1033008 RepID=A0AAD7EBJ2_9AGAR|nr:hypothetical protein DFH08DRAFT_718875 [Mycena albidolilacea]